MKLLFKIIICLFVSQIACNSRIVSQETYTEIPSERNTTGRVYSLNDSVRIYSAGIMPIHFDSSGTMAELNFTPKRINNSKLDGWTVTQASWHYAMGIPDSINGAINTQDGWIGFGGRKGANFFKFRLRNIGYLHWPSRTFQDIGGAPDYDRANLTRTNIIKTVGLNNDSVVVAVNVRWEDLYTTPNGGSVSIQWLAFGDGLKEEVIVDSLARVFITDNLPPDSTASQTYFGFRFAMDWSNIPRVFRGAVETTFSDIDDSSKVSVSLKNTLNELIAFMPVGDVRVDTVTTPLTGNPLRYVRKLRKRIYTQGANSWLLIGERTTNLNQMAPGDLIFDPTSGPTAVSNTVQDGEFNGDTWQDDPGGDGRAFLFDDDEDPGFTFPLPEIPSSATVDSMYIDIFSSNSQSGTPNWQVRVLDEDPATVNQSWGDYGNNYIDSGASYTFQTATQAIAFANNQWYLGVRGTDYLELAGGLTDLLTDYGNIAAGDTIAIAFFNLDTNSSYFSLQDLEHSGTEVSEFYIRWTLAATRSRFIGIF